MPSTSRPIVATGIELELLDPELGRFDLRAACRGAEARARPAVPVPRPADALRPLFPADARHALRAAAGLLHARRHGARAARDRPRGARDRVLRPALVVRLHVLDADAVQRRHAAAAALVLLPDHRARRSRRHLQGDQGQRAAVEVRRRPRQRLDARARPRRAHQGHQRQSPGRRAVPEGRQRHRDRRQPGRQAQGRGLRLPRDLAHRHRGVPRPAQEHRRRPPPHARHEHGQLDARPVHAARRRGRPVDAVLARRGARPARPLRPRVRASATTLLRAEGRARGDARRPSACAPSTCGGAC